MPYLEVLAIYACSRFVVFLGIAFGKAYIPLGSNTWVAGTQWYHWLLRWDSEWYKVIASEGYTYNGDPGLTQTVVFYPLYPTLCRLVSEILGTDIAISMLLVANVAAVAAILLLFKLVQERFGDQIALATVAMISFFPSSVFLSAGYTEPLALLLMVSFFLAVVRERFFLAAVFAGLAVGTRSTGIALFPVLLWELWHCRSPRRFLIDVVPLSMIATSGLWLYMLYLGLAFGHPMAFSDAQAAFHENTTIFARLLSAVTLEPFRKMNLTDISPAGLDQWFTILFMGLILHSWFVGISRGMTLFATILLALPYLTLCGGPAGFTSMARFNIVSFPLFVVMALSIHRLPWLIPGIVGIFGGLLLMYSALFSQWQWIG
ncbi:MAG: mannosyltransferase family protein [Afipia sp.]|nr:mannosyltransferase family protein [Afipia sp.]